MCVSTVYSALSPSPVKKYHMHVTRAGFEPTTRAIITIITRFYIALFTPRGLPKALHIIIPGHWALNHSLNHLEQP